MTSEPRRSVLRRLPIESSEPLVLLAAVRLLLAATALAAVVALGLPYEGRMAASLGALALPWGLANLVLARRAPQRAVSPLVAAGDIVVVAVIGAIVPEAYGALHFTALFLLAVHANLQGERIGAALAALAILALALPAALSDRGEVHGDLLAFYESVFAVAAFATVVLVGRLRTGESASRMRARELSRRALESEQEVRRRVSESIHDGPLQELIGLDIVLAAAHRKAESGDAQATARLLGEARETAQRSVGALRDEMLELGPHAFEGLSLEAAVERCIPVWQRRYGLKTQLSIDPVELPSGAEGELFRIIQEAVVNAAKHGHADTVTIELSSGEGSIRLSIADDGSGFEGVDPLGPAQPGHIGLAAIRERAALLGGRLAIESSEAGSTVSVLAPLDDGAPGGPG